PSDLESLTRRGSSCLSPMRVGGCEGANAPSASVCCICGPLQPVNTRRNHALPKSARPRPTHVECIQVLAPCQVPLMAQRRVATLLNCREWTTIIEALNTHRLIVALSMHLSNLASPIMALLITQSMRSCQRGARIRHADIIGGFRPPCRPHM